MKYKDGDELRESKRWKPLFDIQYICLLLYYWTATGEEAIEFIHADP